MKRLAVILSHPVQYYSPVFQLLAARGKIDIKVFYTVGTAAASKYDSGFGKDIEWDIPLLEGYAYEFLENTAKKPGLHHFGGIKNPDARAAIEKFDPDALLVYGWNYQSHLDLMRFFKKKIKILFRGDSTLIDTKTVWRRWMRSFGLKRVFSHVDLALYVGKENKDYFLQFGLKEEQLVFVPHAIDNARFAQDRKAEANSLRRRFGIKENDILALFAGKLESKKDPSTLIEAFSRLDQRHHQLLIVGNGLLEEGLKQQAKTKGFSNVSFIDFQNQSMMPVVYQAADLFCLPSQGPGETWGLAVNEAMAAGIAVLVSDKAGCARDLVHEGVNGYTFRSGDVEGLAEKLNVMMSSPQKLSEMGKASRSIICEWSFERQVSAIESVLYA